MVIPSNGKGNISLSLSLEILRLSSKEEEEKEDVTPPPTCDSPSSLVFVVARGRAPDLGAIAFFSLFFVLAFTIRSVSSF